MLRYRQDLRSLAYMAVTGALLVVQWSLPSLNPLLFVWSLFMGVSISVISHNHNHSPMWKSRILNGLTDYWLTVFYGFPVFAWVPTHNMNHHRFVNREGDQTITWRYSNKNNLLTLLTYPPISGWFQQRAVIGYLRELWGRQRNRFWHSAAQIALLIVFVAAALSLDWRKGLLYVVAPQQFALFTVMVFNYLQHVHADEESDYNHSRNVVGPWMNRLLFNNGYHTAHHLRPGIHWSRLPEAHAQIACRIDSALQERSFWWLLARTYVLGMFVPRFRSSPLGVARPGR